MPYPLPLTRTEAYLAYKAGVIQQSDLKPSLAVPRNGIDAWLAYWTGLAADYPKKPTVNLFDKNKITVGVRVSTSNGGTYPQAGYAVSSYIPVSPLTTYVLVCGTAAGGSFFSWYDSSKHYISGSGWQNKRTWESPANARYIKFDFKVSEKDIVQFEKAPLSPYSPYTAEPLILQEEEAYIAYLCGVINEYPEKCLRRVGAYLRYLISARWGRPDHPLNREELYLSLIKTQYIPSGDPSSDIKIDGTAKAPFVDVKMYGDTFQQTYSGKNLLNLSASRDFTSGTDYSFDASSGVLTLTMSSASAVNRYSGWCVTGITAGAKYTFSIESFKNSALSNTDRAMMIRSHNGTSALELATLNKTQTSYTFTAPNDSVRLDFYFYIASGDTDSTSIIAKPMLEAGETATAYEPYVGGTPSPSPDYPQPIQTVTGRQVVTVTGKNLFNVEAIPYVARRAYIADGSVVSWTDYTGTDKYQPVEPNTEYTLWNNKTSNTTYICEYDENKNFIRRTIEATTFTTTATTKYLRWSIYVGAGEIPPTQTQLELGSTATAYEPYSSNDYEINLGKNLFDGGISETGKRLSTSTGGSYTDANYDISSYIPVSPDTTYTINTQGRIFCDEYTSNKTFVIGHAQAYGVTDPITITTSSTTRFIRFDFPKGNDTVSQLELGSTPTSYAPYFTPIELCKIGTYQDYIYKDGDDWKVHKATDKHIFNGSEDFSLDDIYNNIAQFRWEDSSVIKISDRYVVYTISDNFRGVQHSQSWTANNAIAAVNGHNALRFMTSLASTVASFQTWLSTHNTKAYYVLATATDTTITDQTLIAQLEALVNGGAENGTTYIKVNATDPNLPGLLYVEAPKYE